jgi:hypothetical protein
VDVECDRRHDRGWGQVAGLIPAAMAYRTPVATNLKPIG